MSIKIKSSLNVAAQTFKKVCVHGPSGVGKTMLAATAAPYRPLVILTEVTGDESLSPENIAKVFGPDREDILYQVDIIEAFDPSAFEEAVNFAIQSDEHDLIIFDSLSKGSRLILKEAKRTNAHGMKAYGEHNDVAMALLEDLVFGDKHVLALCHTKRVEDAESGSAIYVPGFEDQAFTEKSVYDWPHIVYLDNLMDDDGNMFRALRCHTGDSNKRCKNRGGALEELEEPHIGRLLQKLSGTQLAGARPKTKKKKQ